MSKPGTHQPRRPPGTPAGGQFAPTSRPDATGIELIDDDLVEAAAPLEGAGEASATADATAQRLGALERFTNYGPEYNRSVATSLSDYRHFDRLGEADTAEHCLLLAEAQAGLRPWDEFARLDPFERIAKERRAAEAQAAAEVLRLTVEELPVARLRPGDLVWHYGSFYEVTDEPSGAISAGQQVTRVSVQRLGNPDARGGTSAAGVSGLGNPIRHLDYVEGDTVMGWHYRGDDATPDAPVDAAPDAPVDAAATLSPEALVMAGEEAKALDQPVDTTGATTKRSPRVSAKEAIARIFPDGEPQQRRRGHKLLPQELVERIPELYETDGTPLEDKVIHAHYFIGAADWHIAELDRETGEMFGRCNLGLGYPEWGYVRIQDLAELKGQFGLPVERELDFEPKTARDLGLVKE